MSRAIRKAARRLLQDEGFLIKTSGTNSGAYGSKFKHLTCVIPQDGYGFLKESYAIHWDGLVDLRRTLQFVKADDAAGRLNHELYCRCPRAFYTPEGVQHTDRRCRTHESS